LCRQGALGLACRIVAIYDVACNFPLFSFATPPHRFDGKHEELANRIKNASFVGSSKECGKEPRKSNKHFHLSSGDQAAYTQFVEHFVSLLHRTVSVQFGSCFGCKFNLL